VTAQIGAPNRNHLHNFIDIPGFEKIKDADGKPFLVRVLKPGVFFWEHMTPEEKAFYDALPYAEQMKVTASVDPFGELDDRMKGRAV
jgi:hypothetical protein